MQQSELIAKILAGEVAGIPPVEAHLETHLSHVFLTRDRAYKLKRAVRLPFVDFSSVEQRRLACLAEVDVNASLGSPLYIGVIPVCRSHEGRCWVGLEAEVVDYLVTSELFDAGCQFDELAKTGRLTIEHVQLIAGQIAAMHAGAASSGRLGHVADYRHVLSGLRDTEIDGANRLGIAAWDRDVYDMTDRALSRVSGLIEQRRREGKVRRGHGDLHLRNLCLFGGKPALFDALEFNDAFATTDTLFDLAFLLMDLRARGLARHANAVMNTYWDAARENENGLQLLPTFTALRALTRRAVAIERGDLEEAERYRRLTLRLLAPHTPRRIAIGGLSGSGKSTIARLLAPRLSGPAGARILRTDVLRQRLQLRSQKYALAARASVYEALAAAFRQASDAGASVVVDATFANAGFAAAFFNRAGEDVRRFWLRASDKRRVARVTARRGDASEISPEIAALQAEPPVIDAGWTIIDADMPTERVSHAILKELAREVHAA